MINCKCKGCEKRRVGCHDKCEDYISLKKESSVEKKKMQDDNIKPYSIAHTRASLKALRRGRQRNV